MLKVLNNMKMQVIFLVVSLIIFTIFSICTFFRPIYAQTWVEGHITSDTTWTIRNSPYRAINDVTVDAGVRLTIEPGVEVQFADGFSLIVHGSLEAVGTDANPIIFSSSRVSPSPGAWNTIIYENSSGSFVLKHTKVEYAVQGISIRSLGDTVIENNQIFNCSESGILLDGENNVVLNENSMKYNNYGIKISNFENLTTLQIIGNVVSNNQYTGLNIVSGGNLSNFAFSNNVVSENGKSGIYVDADEYLYDVSFSSNTIQSNGQNGIDLNSPRDVYDVSFSSNTIQSNGQNGIYVYADDNIYNVSFLSNTIIANEQNGIYLDVDDYDICDVSFSSNTIQSNGQNGIYVYADKYLYDILVSGSTIVSNGESGIDLYGRYGKSYEEYEAVIFSNIISYNKNGIKITNVHSNLTHNSISYNNDCGINYRYSDNLAQHNDIYQNFLGMKVENGAKVNAEYNYWGDSTGPYHESLNPEGKGNSVNGDGTDLDFIPFLYSPVGDIQLPSLNVQLSLLTALTVSEGQARLIVSVTDGTSVVENVQINLISENGGSLSPSSGYTDSNGELDVTFIAPHVNEKTSVKITASASKSGYEDGSDYEYIDVYPLETETTEPTEPEPEPEESSPEPKPEQPSNTDESGLPFNITTDTLLVIIAVIAIVVVAVIAFKIGKRPEKENTYETEISTSGE